MSPWDDILRLARPDADAFAKAMVDIRRQQTGLLVALLRQNAATQFGRNHKFEAIGTIDAFRNTVPIRTYADYRSWIDEVALGRSAVLTADPVIVFEETGGTSTGRKLVPYTAGSLLSFRAAILPWLLDLAARRPKIRQGSVYASISPSLREKQATAGGLPIGLPSDAAYLGEDLLPAFARLLAVSPDAPALQRLETWRSATLAMLVARTDLAFVSVWSPTFWLQLIQSLPAAAEDVARHLHGQGDHAALARLQRAIAGAGVDTRLLWPGLDTISCWTEGASALFARQLGALFPEVHIDGKGLLSTECAISVPLGGEPGAVPALTSGFLEFLDDGGRSCLADELAEGLSYRVVVTTAGGLYRYDTGDRISCVSVRQGVPRIVFEGRAGLNSDLVGEKLEETFVGSVLAAFPCHAALVARTAPSAHYEIWFDTPRSADIAAWTAAADTALGQNPQYAYARATGQLSRPFGLANPGFWQQSATDRRRPGDLKPVWLIPLSGLQTAGLDLSSPAYSPSGTKI